MIAQTALDQRNAWGQTTPIEDVHALWIEPDMWRRYSVVARVCEPIPLQEWMTIIVEDQMYIGLPQWNPIPKGQRCAGGSVFEVEGPEGFYYFAVPREGLDWLRALGWLKDRPRLVRKSVSDGAVQHSDERIGRDESDVIGGPSSRRENHRGWWRWACDALRGLFERRTGQS